MSLANAMITSLIRQINQLATIYQESITIVKAKSGENSRKMVEKKKLLKE